MVSKMEGDASLSGLLCLENEIFLEEKEELVYENYIAVYDEECVQMLFDREISYGFKKNESLVLSNYFKYDRLEAITRILKKRAALGFRFQTAYLSIIYFDRFLSMRSDSEKSWPIQLLSIVCLSLAAKMEEIEVPVLSEFQVEECNFGSKMIQRMELLVLNTLEWRMSPITPFDFLHFFITKMCKESPTGDFVSRTVQVIFAIMREINLMEHRPSVVAAAATLMVLDQRLTRKALECMMNSVSFCGFLETEDIFTCYNLMQRLEMEKLNIPKSVNSPDLSPTHLRAINVLDDSSSSGSAAAVCTKRKRLTFNKNENKQS